MQRAFAAPFVQCEPLGLPIPEDALFALPVRYTDLHAPLPGLRDIPIPYPDVVFMRSKVEWRAGVDSNRTQTGSPARAHLARGFRAGGWPSPPSAHARRK